MNYDYECKHCDMQFEKWQALASHVKYAHGKSWNVYKELARQGALKRLDQLYGVKKEFTVICKTCSTHFTVIEREKQHPKKEKYYCSIPCANTRKHTIKSKQKTSASVKTAWENGKFDNVNHSNPSRSSKAEREIAQFFKNRYGAKKVLRQRVKEYYGIRRAVDLLLPEFNAVIEYDGIFHFKEIYANTFDRIKEKDDKQNKYCKNNGIKLIRVKYTVYEKNKQSTLNKIIDLLENHKPDVYLLYD